jgi:hypothetical protein
VPASVGTSDPFRFSRSPAASSRSEWPGALCTWQPGGARGISLDPRSSVCSSQISRVVRPASLETLRPSHLSSRNIRAARCRSGDTPCRRHRLRLGHRDSGPLVRWRVLMTVAHVAPNGVSRACTGSGRPVGVTGDKEADALLAVHLKQQRESPVLSSRRSTAGAIATIASVDDVSCSVTQGGRCSGAVAIPRSGPLAGARSERTRPFATDDR